MRTILGRMHALLRTAVLLAPLLALACTSGGESPYAQALAEAKTKDELVFVDFWTTWCGYCKKLEKETFPAPAVRAELETMVVLSVDAESETGKPIAKQFHVDAYPTMLVLDANGKELGRIAGFLEPEPFLARLAKIRARAAR